MVKKLSTVVCYVFLICMVTTVHAADIIVTPFTACTNCALYDVLYPSATEYLLQTNDNNVFHSSNEGQNWTLVLPQVRYMYGYADTVDAYSVVFWTISGNLYRSSNGGFSTTQCTSPGVSISSVFLHPTQSGWLGVRSCGSTCIIKYSQDFCVTWKSGPTGLLSGGSVQWSVAQTAPDTIFALNSASSFGYTTDYGATWVTLFTNSIGFVVTNHFLYVGVQISSTAANLYASSSRNDPGHTVKANYILSEFPFGASVPEQGYTFLDDTTSSEFIGVVNSGNDARWGTLYSSDFEGDQFALSLRYVAETSLYYDFDKFAGLAGIYAANAYPNTTSTAKHTLITYDNGGEWRYLTAPSLDINGAQINCSVAQGCSLHLHGLLSWYFGWIPPFYSSPNAIGLMVGVGNLGTAVSSSQSTLGTYLTRDGGLTWRQLYNQATVYEFGDHGGILVFATITAPTNHVFYSTDEGNTYTTFQFTTTAINVDNIIIETSGTGRKFVLFGTLDSTHYIFGLDFTPVTPTACTDSDYEQWSPSDGEHGNLLCFMGSTTVYRRRKQLSQCYNDRDTDHIISNIPCLCAFSDYECDVGYSPSIRNSTDGFDCTYDSPPAPSCATGYRLVPDTICAGGLDLTTINCNGKKNTGAIVGVVLLFIFLVGGAGVVGYLYWKNDRFRQFVLEKLGRSKDASYGRLNTGEGDDDGEF